MVESMGIHTETTARLVYNNLNQYSTEGVILTDYSYY